MNPSTYFLNGAQTTNQIVNGSTNFQYLLNGALVGAFTPLSLFSGGVQGVWYDPSDLTTMFEDSAGTTAVHTPGNGTADSPVGKILDKSGNGNHATQSTSTKRPTLSAKYNLLTYTEDFSNAAWTKSNVTITSNSTTDPLGGSTASTYTANATSNAQLYQLKSVTSPTATYTFSVFLKKNSARYGFVNAVFGGSDDRYSVAIDLQTGTFASSATLNSPANKSYVISDAGNGWYKLSVSCSSATATGSVYLCVGGTSVFPIVFDGGLFVSTAVNDSIYIWGADLRATNDGVGLPAYQRVVDANTYDSVGFPYYLKSDGVDDALQSSAVAINNFALVIGGAKIGTAASGYPFFEHGPNVNANNGFYIYGDGPTNVVTIRKTGGTAYLWNANTPTNWWGTSNAVVTTYYDFVNAVLRKNTSQLVSAGYSISETVTDNFNLFSRNQTSIYSNMRMYGLILCGTNLTDGQLANTESWMNGKTKAY